MAGEEVEPSGLPESPPQQELIGQGFPLPWGVSGQSGQGPVEQARPLSWSGTGEGAGEVRLPNRQSKYVLTGTGGKRATKCLIWFGLFRGLILIISKIARK